MIDRLVICWDVAPGLVSGRDVWRAWWHFNDHHWETAAHSAEGLRLLIESTYPEIKWFCWNILGKGYPRAY